MPALHRAGPAVALLSAALIATPASGYTLHLGAASAEKPFSASGCTAAKRTVAVPRDATHVRPADDSSTSTVLAGPLAFYEEPSKQDEDEFGDYAIDYYAYLDRFKATPGRATWTVHADKEWCAGYTGDPHKQAPPKPASKQADPQSDPTYHRGWITQPFRVHAIFTLKRTHLYTIDPKGRTRSTAPATLAASKDHTVTVTGITWKNWGKASPTGRGTAHFKGRTAPAKIFADYLTLGSHLRGCAAGRVYYESLTIWIPKLAERSTDYRIDNTCRGAEANGQNTIDEAMTGSGGRSVPIR